MPTLDIVEVDPQGPDALALLREAAVEARTLYADVESPDRPWPTNPPTPPRGAYLVAYLDGRPVACGALRPLDDAAAEVRRMYVARAARRRGLARAMLDELEARACGLGYTVLRLETGNRQAPAIALYESCGYTRIEPFGEHVGDPLSVCLEKSIAPEAGP